MTLSQEAEIKFKKHKILNGDDTPVVHITVIPPNDQGVMAIQSHNGQVSSPRLNWNATLTCYRCGVKDVMLQSALIQVT